MTTEIDLTQLGRGEARTKIKGDRVIYYRRSRELEEEAGWIVIGDSASGTKLEDHLRRGFEPMMKYGVVNSPRNEARFLPNGKGAEIWGAILSQPGGPQEFPAEQVITFRWYDPEKVPIPGATFPQLKGLRIQEYQCPACKRNFVNVEGLPKLQWGVGNLASHLTIWHGWDRAALIAYGEKVGIDFVVVAPVREVVYEVSATKEKAKAEPEYQVETVAGRGPGRPRKEV